MQVVAEDDGVDAAAEQFGYGLTADLLVESGDHDDRELDLFRHATTYQLALRTPGSCPAWARVRRLMRERPKAPW